MKQQERLIQFPFLITLTFAGYLLPQFISFTLDPYATLPDGALSKTVFMAILCLLAAWLGYISNKKEARLFQWEFSQRRLAYAGLALTLSGAYFHYQVILLAPNAMLSAGGQWTGIITIYSFFAKLLMIGFVISFISYLRKPSMVTLSAVLVGLIFYLERILIQGRRASMVELVLTMLLAFWFVRGWRPPRWLMLTAAISGALIINSIGDYRHTMLGSDRATWSGAGISEIIEIDFVENLTEAFSDSSRNHDVENASYNIEATDRLKNFDYGLSHWNWLVHRYIPAQLFGKEMKESLLIDFADITSASNNAKIEFDYSAFPGSTPTGLSDTFQSFWYFGAISFWIVGLVMNRWYLSAMQGYTSAQIIIILLVSPSLHAITHSSHWFFIFFLQLGVFLLPALFFAKKRRRG